MTYLVLSGDFRTTRIEQSVGNQTDERLSHSQCENDCSDDLMRTHSEHSTARHEDYDESCQDHGNTHCLKRHVNFEPSSREYFQVSCEERAAE